MNEVKMHEEAHLNEYVVSLFGADSNSLIFEFEGSNRTFRFSVKGINYYLRESNERWHLKDIMSEVEFLNSMQYASYVPKLLKITHTRDDIEKINDFIFQSAGKYYFTTKGITGERFVGNENQLRNLGQLLNNFHNRTQDIFDKKIYKDKRIKCDIHLTGLENRKLNEYKALCLQKRGFIEQKVFENMDFISKEVDKILKNLKGIDELSDTIIHNDVTPNNLIFENSRIIGLLDYEYISYREKLYDLAWTIATTCYGDDLGTLDKCKVETLVNSYYCSRGYKIDKMEKEILIEFIRLSVIAAIKWTADQYFHFGLEKTRNFAKNIHLIKWLSNKNLSFL